MVLWDKTVMVRNRCLIVLHAVGAMSDSRRMETSTLLPLNVKIRVIVNGQHQGRKLSTYTGGMLDGTR